MSLKNVVATLLARQQELMERNQQLLEIINNNTQANLGNARNIEHTMDVLSRSITEFRYDPDSDHTFSKWYTRYKDLFETDAQQIDDAAKVRLLLRKISSLCYDKYVDYILPKQSKELDFKVTVETLTKVFGRQQSIFNSRFSCLQTVKKDNEDYVTFAAIVNRDCENFEITKMTVDQFKSLIFVTGLQSPKDAELRARLLTILDGENELSPVTIQKLVNEVHRIINLKKDTSMIENSIQSAVVQKIHQKPVKHFQHKKQNGNFRKFNSEQNQPRTPCWNCGEMHFYRDCTFKYHKCTQCEVIRHKNGYCNSLLNKSKSSLTQNNQASSNHNKFQNKHKSNCVKSVHEIYSYGKRRHLNVNINNKTIKLQLDTGSDISIISKNIWQLIGEPQLKPTGLRKRCFWK